MERGMLIMIIVGGGVLTAAIVVAIAVPLALKSDTKATNAELARQYMQEVPLIDGHNDLPWQLKKNVDNRLQDVDLNTDLTQVWTISHTDIPRLREGLVGAQFWAAYTSCDSQYKDTLMHTLDQIDVIKRMVEMYPETFDFVTTAQGITDSFENGKIASLIGVEGGHSMDSSLATLRMLYELGVRYMTVTHSCNTPWADNWKESPNPNPEHDGLTPFGLTVIDEMNRLGMLIDLSHVSEKTMEQVLERSKAPVIFSHTSAFTICAHYRNAPDYILEIVKQKRGVVMVNFYNTYINCPPMNITDDDTYATLAQVADHMDHIKDVCGYECVGFGSDYDGVSYVPEGLEDVSTFPALVEELINRGWTEVEVKAALGNNLLRVFRETEAKSAELRGSTLPGEVNMPRDSGEEVNNTCRTYYYNP